MEKDQIVHEPGWLQIIIVGRNPKRTLLRALVLAGVCAVGFRLVLLPIRVEGISMLPTYHDHAFNFVNRLAYVLHPPRRGDVVSVRTAGLSVMYLKRVVGLPGETIEFQDGQLMIDGQSIFEPWLKLPSDWTLPPRKLGPNEFYVVGDNRSMPPYNHTQGVAVRQKIVGKVVL
jgi:signal peptidase I